MLAAQLEAAGAVVTRLAAVADDEDAHRRRDRAGPRARRARHLGRRLGRPARPRAAGRGRARRRGGLLARRRAAGQAGRRSASVGATLVFGLPGNPVSSLVGCELFVRPAVLALQGAADPGPAVRGRPARRRRRAQPGPRRPRSARARRSTDDGVVLEPVSGQESHMIVRAAEADALVLVPRGRGRARRRLDRALPAALSVRRSGSRAVPTCTAGRCAARPGRASRRRGSGASRRSAGGRPGGSSSSLWCDRRTARSSAGTIRWPVTS